LPFVTDDGGQAICLNTLLDEKFQQTFKMAHHVSLTFL